MAKKLGKALEKAIKKEEAPGKKRRNNISTRTRLDIYSYLTYVPMARKSTIGQALEVTSKTVDWHLSRLVEKGYVSCHNGLFYPTGFIQPDDIGLALVFSKKTARMTYSTICKNPGTTQMEIGAENGLSKSVVSSIIHNLKEFGLISCVEDGRVLRSYPTELLQDKTKEYGKRAVHFVDHLKKLLSHEGVRFEVERRGDTFTAVLEEGASRRTLSFNTNPFIYASLVQIGQKA